jgi:DtxR family transcriptional regulator, Mn-dependent transcriptional regulator
MPSITVENYLKAILHLRGESSQEGRVAVGRIATHLGLTPGTVTTMMKHLAKEGFIRYEPRKGVFLTTEGERVGWQIIRRHRLIELFLVEIMHLDWAHVHEEAEELEHALSDRMVERIDEMLGRPAYDPHGEPIPDANGRLREEAISALTDCEKGWHKLMRISRDDPAFLKWLHEQGLRPGVMVDLVSRDKQAEVLLLQVAGSQGPVTISEAAASCLWVK